jgi:hypothetical protein
LSAESPFDHERFRALLGLSADAVLVGGQSLAVWAEHFGVEPGPPLVPFISHDVDFFAGKPVAKEIARRLGGKLFFPAPDDHVQINSAVVTFGTGEKYERVDFLAAVAGMDGSKIRQRAVEVEAWGANFRVMHPVDCLESRLQNLELLPHKRNDVGIAQAKLAMQIVRALIERTLAAGNARDALALAEHVGYLSRSRAAGNAAAFYGVSVLDAIPLDSMPAEFKKKRWPQLRKYAARKRPRAGKK